MDAISTTHLAAVKAVVVETLEVDEDRAQALGGDTPLLGSLPELDSMAVVQLVLALEDEFAIAVDGDDVTAEVFETLASLAAFVDGKLTDRRRALRAA